MTSDDFPMAALQNFINFSTLGAHAYGLGPAAPSRFKTTVDGNLPVSIDEWKFAPKTSLVSILNPKICY